MQISINIVKAVANRGSGFDSLSASCLVKAKGLVAGSEQPDVATLNCPELITED